MRERGGRTIAKPIANSDAETIQRAVLKRGIIGVYHHVSPDHLGRYVDEFAFRLNEGNVKRHTLDRLESLATGAAGKRLTYKELIQ